MKTTATTTTTATGAGYRASYNPKAKTGEVDWKRITTKELVSYWEAVVISNKVIKNPVTVITYKSRSPNASTVYAILRVITKDNIYIYGQGLAGGCGYHKASAAVGAALRSAGITLDVDISGGGSSAIEAAVVALARDVAGYKGKVTIIQK